MRLKKMDFIINSNDLQVVLLSNDKDYNIKQRKQPKVQPKSKSLLWYFKQQSKGFNIALLFR